MGSCQAGERSYGQTYSQFSADGVAATEALSVAFENLPAIKSDSSSINVRVIGKHGATEYKYALLDGNAAIVGSSACIASEYSDFIAITQPIVHAELEEGAYFLCAKGQSDGSVLQKQPTTFAWLIDYGDSLDDEEATADD